MVDLMEGRTADRLEALMEDRRGGRSVDRLVDLMEGRLEGQREGQREGRLAAH